MVAIVIGLIKAPRKREEKLQWILLVIKLLALIPVLGGVFKGVGRLVAKAMGEVAHLVAGAERAAKLAEAAKDIVAFLNRVGVGNAEVFLQKLKFADHQQVVVVQQPVDLHQIGARRVPRPGPNPVLQKSPPGLSVEWRLSALARSVGRYRQDESLVACHGPAITETVSHWPRTYPAATSRAMACRP